MADVYVEWIKDALRRNPRLSQSGLAKHLGRHRSVVTMMLQGDREIKARELERIASYLGEPAPGQTHAPAPETPKVPVVGRISAAWYEMGETHNTGEPETLPQLDNAKARAYVLDLPAVGLPAGAYLIALPVERGTRIATGDLVILRRERAGLVNISVGVVGEDGAVAGVADGTPVAVVVEARVRYR